MPVAFANKNAHELQRRLDLMVVEEVRKERDNLRITEKETFHQYYDLVTNHTQGKEAGVAGESKINARNIGDNHGYGW